MTELRVYPLPLAGVAHLDIVADDEVLAVEASEGRLIIAPRSIWVTHVNSFPYPGPNVPRTYVRPRPFQRAAAAAGLVGLTLTLRDDGALVLQGQHGEAEVPTLTGAEIAAAADSDPMLYPEEASPAAIERLLAEADQSSLIRAAVALRQRLTDGQLCNIAARVANGPFRVPFWLQNYLPQRWVVDGRAVTAAELYEAVFYAGWAGTGGFYTREMAYADYLRVVEEVRKTGKFSGRFRGSAYENGSARGQRPLGRSITVGPC